MYKYNNPNPDGKVVGDCTVRAISLVAGKSWDQIYCELAAEGFNMKDMPDANAVWGSVLRKNGFRRHPIQEDDCTVKQFCDQHRTGVYLLALPTHAVASINGNHVDTWDSSDEQVIYYWTKED